MKPYLKQTVSIYSIGEPEGDKMAPPAEGYYLAFAQIMEEEWYLIWAPFA